MLPLSLILLGWGGGFENQTEYSYGYVARVVGHNFYESRDSTNSKRLKRDLSKAQEAEAELVLVEKVGNQSVPRLEDKRSLTPKKFFLVGSNRTTGEVEVTGLVSLIQYKHGGISAKCSKKEEEGALLNGLCDKEIFKANDDPSKAPKFIKEELKDKDGNSSVAIMQLTPKGKSLGVVWGQKKKSSGGGVNGWSRTGYLYLSGKDTSTSGENNIVRKAWTTVGTGGAKGFFVVHDLIFSENGMSKEWVKNTAKWGTILVEGVKNKSDFSSNKKKDIRALEGTDGGEKVIDIPLSSSRNYYIWDPSKTKIKNGEFVTDDGVKLPFKLGVNATWSSSLVK